MGVRRGGSRVGNIVIVMFSYKINNKTNHHWHVLVKKKPFFMS